MTRPQLDQMTLWRAEQCARLENRSLASAISVLVEAGWRGRTEAMTHRAMHEAGPKSEPVNPYEKTTMSLYLPTAIADDVRKQAEAERRSASSLVHSILAEALRSRASTAT